MLIDRCQNIRYKNVCLSFKGRELTSEEKIGITYGAGVSLLTLDDITADHAGKYEVSVENLLALDRQFFSLAVEGN